MRKSPLNDTPLGARRGSNSQENEGKPPDFQICARSCPSFEIEGLCLGIVTVPVDATQEKRGFVGFQKPPCRLLRNLIGKVDNEDVSKDTNDGGQDALNDEDPSPTAITGDAVLRDIL